jgi:hypothetical protein
MSFVQAIIKNPTRSLEMLNKSTSQVIVNREVLDLTAGLAVPATSSSTRDTVAGVSNQAISAADALSQVPIIEAFQNDVWIADATNNSNPLHNGQDMILTDSLTVNNTGTTSAVGVVQQVGVYGAAADKKILVRFITH